MTFFLFAIRKFVYYKLDAGNTTNHSGTTGSGAGNNSGSGGGVGRTTKRKVPSQRKVSNSSKLYQSMIDQSTLSAVKREENSIKRVMLLVDKRMTNNRTSYTCKWPNCGYDTTRSVIFVMILDWYLIHFVFVINFLQDSIVRHIRQRMFNLPFFSGILIIH